MIALCTVLCGGQGAVDMALFARSKEPFLRSFLKLANGLPSHDTFRPRRSGRFREQGRARATVRRRNGPAILRSAGRRRGGDGRLCRHHRRDLEAVRGAHAIRRLRVPPVGCRRAGRLPGGLTDHGEGGAERGSALPFRTAGRCRTRSTSAGQASGQSILIGKDGARPKVVATYGHWLLGQPRLMAQFDRLRGRHLLWWCAPRSATAMCCCGSRMGSACAARECSGRCDDEHPGSVASRLGCCSSEEKRAPPLIVPL